MSLCIAFRCKNKGRHRFPVDETRRKQWVNALRLKNWKPNSSSRLCREHFKPDDFYSESRYTGLKHERKNLKRGSVPSVFSFLKQEVPKSKRRLRYEARSIPAIEDDQTNDDISSNRIQTTVPSLCYVYVPDIGCEIVIPEAMEEENVNLLMAVDKSKSDKNTQINIEHIYGSISHFKDDDIAIMFYTGFESYQKFYLVYSTLSPLAPKLIYFSHHVLNVSYEDQFFLTLMKLRQNKTIFELSKFFCISSSTVSNIFITWVNFIYQMWKTLDIWPSRDLIDYYMPESFKQYDKSVRVILDGTEFPVQKPENTVTQQATMEYI